MISEVVAHLWQCTLVAGAAGILALALRWNRAQVRYWVWFAASAKFLIPFSVLVSLGSLMPRPTAAPSTPPTWVVVAVEQIGQPLALAAGAAMSYPARHDYWVAAAFGVWACGFLCIAACGLGRWKEIWVMRQSARPVALRDSAGFPVQVMSVPGRFEPGVFGLLRPAVLLPEGIVEQLNPAELETILAHELCHVRRRDTLTAAIHMIVEAIFWFHPLVWWLGWRLIDERERACDEEVMRLGGDPRCYAESILKVCELYLESQVACVAGFSGSNLKKRIEGIVNNRIVRELSRAKELLLAATGVLALAAPVAIGVLNAQPIRAQSPQVEVGAAQKFAQRQSNENHSGEPGLLSASSGRTSIPETRLTFGVASIRPSKTDEGWFWDVTPGGRVVCRNCTLKRLIVLANRVQEFQVVGGPAWVSKDQFDIEAKPDREFNPTDEQSRQMLRSLLEERFRLRLRAGTRTGPVYALTIVRNGPQRSAEQAPPDETGPPPDPNGPMPRGAMRITAGSASGKAVPIALLARFLGQMLGRPVIDKTGLIGRYDIDVRWTPEFAPQDLQPGTPDAQADGPSLFTALQEQAGLKLKATIGPVQELVIESGERPSDN